MRSPFALFVMISIPLPLLSNLEVRNLAPLEYRYADAGH